MQNDGLRICRLRTLIVVAAVSAFLGFAIARLILLLRPPPDP